MRLKRDYRVFYHFQEPVGYSKQETQAIQVKANDDRDAEFLAYSLLTQRGDGDAIIDRVERV